jgi:DNA-binding response OmpR family regulator
MPISNPSAPITGSVGPCLVLEDDSIILIDIEYTLHSVGYTDVHTATSLARAEEILDACYPVLALLDFEVGASNSLRLARKLVERQISFLFLTAYGDTVELPDDLRHIPVVSKPFTTDLLLHTIALVQGGRTSFTEAKPADTSQ